MKGKICGLLLALFITLGLSLSVSLDTNALKYEIKSVPFFGAIGRNDSSTAFYQPLSLSYDSSSGVTYSPPTNYFWKSSFDDSEHTCSYWRYYNAISNDNSSISLSSDAVYYLNYLPYSSDSYHCASTDPFGSGVSWRFIRDSLPSYSFGNPDLALNLPYWFQFNAAYVSDLDVTDGLYRRSKLDLSEVFGSAPTSFYSMVIPLGVDEGQTGDLSVNEPVELSGSFMFDSDDPENDVFEINSSSNFAMYFDISGHYSEDSSDVTSQSALCSYSVVDNRSNSNEYPWELSYSCKMNLTSSYLSGQYGLTLRLTRDNGSGTIFDYPAKVFLIESVSYITNNDSTPASEAWGSSVVTSDPSIVPGTAFVDTNTADNVSWFDSFLNMFSFNFFNPFAGIFNLFADNSSCVNIPIIAGMINSQETQVCPWFNSTTRNIATPVLGIASVMLVFGFAVRWLGASSGNLFEDSRHEEVSNQGGRWGHYKKGGN